MKRKTIAIAGFAGATLLVRAATNQLYTVTVPALDWKMTNCIEARLHTNDCYLIRWVEKGKTNEFHAWMVPVKIEKQPRNL